MLHVLSRLPGKLQDPRLVHTASRTRLLVFQPHHASWLRHHPAALALPQPRCASRLLVVRSHQALLRLRRASERAVSPLDFSSAGRTGSHRVPGHSVVRRDYPSRGRNGYTSTTPHVRVPRHVARLVTRLAAPLVFDYFAYVARPGASARRAARRAACCRLLRLRRASGCLGTSRGLSRGSSSTTSSTPRVRVPQHIAQLVTRPVVDYFDYAARPGASARRVTRRRLLCLRRASGCLGTSRGLSRGSSSTTSPTHVRVPRHVARLVA
jgi:hypothetical protein